MTDSQRRVGGASAGEPPSASALKPQLERQIQRICDWASREIRRIEERRDVEVRCLEGAVNCVAGSGSARGERNRRPRSTRSKRGRRSRSSATPAAVNERREAVKRFVEEAGAPVSRGDISRGLGLTVHTVTTALTLLRNEGQVRRVGTNASTRYLPNKEGSHSGSSSPTRDLSSAGTLQGRILATIQERGWASPEELVQATGASREEVLRECGALVREEEIKMDRREGRSVYVTRGQP